MTVTDLLHAIVNKLSIHDNEKAELHAKIDEDSPEVESGDSND